MQVQRDHGSMSRREAPQRIAQHGRLGWFGKRCRELCPLARTSPQEHRQRSASGLADCLARDDPIEPRTEAGRVANGAALTPGSLERGLDGVLRLIGITGDQASEAHEARIVLVDEGFEHQELDTGRFRRTACCSAQCPWSAHGWRFLGVMNDRPANGTKRTIRGVKFAAAARGPDYIARMPSRLRAMTMRWISLVPSPISVSFASRR